MNPYNSTTETSRRDIESALAGVLFADSTHNNYTCFVHNASNDPIFFSHLDCTHGDLRLAGGETSSEGRLEICFNSVWGTVCDDFWGAPDAQVACAQLGYTRTGKSGNQLHMHSITTDN